MLETEISRTARAVVYRGRHAGHGQPVAVKLLLPPANPGPDWIGAAQERLERARRLRSEHTVRILASGEHEGTPYAVLEWTDERSLAGELPLPPTLAARLVVQLAEAVHEAHSVGLVHGGISLGHVFLDERGNARLVGFAAAPRPARGQDYSEREFEILPPELVRRPGTPVGVRSDIYALGSVLFTLLTGAAPFRAATTAERLRMLRSSEAPSPLQIHPALPRGFEVVCAKSLAREPARRYDTALALAADLELLVRNEPLARRTSGGATVWRWIRRRPGAAFLLAAGLAGLSMLLVWLEHSREAAQRRTWELLVQQGRFEQASGDPAGALARLREAAQINRHPTLGQAVIESLNRPHLEVLNHLPVDSPRFVRFSPDGTMVAIAGASTSGSSEATGGALVSVFALPGGNLLGSHHWLASAGPPTFHPERAWLAWPQPDGTTALWAPDSHQPPTLLPTCGMPVFSPGGNRIAIGAELTTVFEVDSLRRLAGEGDGRPLVWADEDTLLLALHHQLALWHPATQDEPPRVDLGTNVCALAAHGEVAAGWTPRVGTADFQLEFYRPTDGARLWAPPGLVSESPRVPVLLRRSGTLAFVVDPVDRSLMRLLDVARRRYLGIFTLPGLDLNPRRRIAGPMEAQGWRVNDGSGSPELASAVSPDGRFFAAALDREPNVLEVHDLAEGALVAVAHAAVEPTWSADGRFLAWLSREPGRSSGSSVAEGSGRATVTIARLHIPAPSLRLEHAVPQIFFLEDGRELIAGGQRVTVQSGNEDAVLRARGGPSPGTWLQPLGNGDFWTTPSPTIAGAEPAIVSTVSGRVEPFVLPARPGITVLTFAPDGEHLLAARVEILGTAEDTESRTNEFELWNLRRRQRVAVWPAEAPGYAGGLPVFSPDGTKLASALFQPEGAEIIEVATGKRDHLLLTAETGRTPKPGFFSALRSSTAATAAPAHRVRLLRFSPDGWRLFAATAAGWLCACDVATGRVEFALPVHSGEITALAVSRDGAWLATCGADGMIRLARADDGSEVARWDVAGRTWSTLEFSPDAGLLVAGSEAGSLQLWNLDQLRRELRGFGMGW